MIGLTVVLRYSVPGTGPVVREAGTWAMIGVRACAVGFEELGLKNVRVSGGQGRVWKTQWVGELMCSGGFRNIMF